MVIGVDIRWVTGKDEDDYGQFVAEVLRRLVQKHHAHQFYFISDEAKPQFVQHPNVQYVIVKPAANTPLLWKYWYDIKLPGVLKKIKADVFLALSGFCSLRSKVPQCVVVADLDVLTRKRSHRFFYRRYLPRFFRKAQTVVTISESVKQQIISTHQIDRNRISLLPLAVNEMLHPLDWEEKEAIKERYTEAKEYFISSSVISSKEELVDLLKAFSFFKKRQQSGMKLVLAGKILADKKIVEELLATFKHRNDVVLTDEETEKLIAAAYAMIYTSAFKTYGIPVLQAITCNVPVISVQEPLVEEITEGNALWFKKGIANELAEQMMYVYKDENERSRLIQKGGDVIQKYKMETTVDKLGQIITQVITKP